MNAYKSKNLMNEPVIAITQNIYQCFCISVQ